MQRQDDRPSKGGRPSLLSSDQQAEAERQRILSTLDSKPAAPAAAAQAPAKRAGGLIKWGAVGVGVVAVIGGALAWMSNTPDEDSIPLAVVAAPVKPAAAASAPAEAEVSTAAILEETAPTTPPADEKLPSLKEMLTAPAKPKTGHEELRQALERPQAKAPQLAQAERKPEHKHEHKAERKPEHKTDKLAQKAAPAKDKAAGKPDNDVTLITALMAHLQARPPVKKTSSPADQLKTCKQYNAAGEEQCRARLCAAEAKKEPECKVPPVAKTAANS